MDTPRLLLAVAIGAFAAGAACAQSTVVTGGSVTIMEPAQLSKEADLTVGAFNRPTSGSRTAQAASASYTVTGLSGETFNVAAPGSISLTRSGGADQIELVLKPTTTVGLVNGVTGQRSVTTFGVDGAVPVNSTTAAGLYEGKFGVTVAFP